MTPKNELPNGWEGMDDQWDRTSCCIHSESNSYFFFLEIILLKKRHYLEVTMAEIIVLLRNVS